MSKFRCTKASAAITGLEADFENAVQFENVWVGDLGIYYKSGFKTVFFSYAELERVFIRVQEVNGKLCCGKASFYYYRMVFVVNGKEYFEPMSENETVYDDALALIAKKAPNLSLGCPEK